MPKLRKENLYVESEINTTLQTYLYDFLYDQQDLYDFYDPQLKSKQSNNSVNKSSDLCHLTKKNSFNVANFSSIVKVKSKQLPFADSLENFVVLIQEFKNNGVDKEMFGKLRWYLNDEDGAYFSNSK